MLLGFLLSLNYFFGLSVVLLAGVSSGSSGDGGSFVEFSSTSVSKSYSKADAPKANENCFRRAYDLVPGFNCNFLGKSKNFVTLHYLQCYLDSAGRPPMPSVCDEVWKSFEEYTSNPSNGSNNEDGEEDAKKGGQQQGESGVETQQDEHLRKQVKSCTQAMSEAVFALYTESHNHIDDLCAIMQSQLWRQQTDVSVNRLTSSSHRLTTLLEESNESQTELLSNQRLSIEQGNALQSHIQDASNSFQGFQKEVGGVFENVREQFETIQGGLNTLSLLMKTVHGTILTIRGVVSRFESAAVFILGLMICVFCTLLPSTRQALPTLLALCSGNFLLEVVIYSLMTGGGGDLAVKCSRAVFLLAMVRICVGRMLNSKPKLEMQVAKSIRSSMEGMQEEMARLLKEQAESSALSTRGISRVQMDIVEHMAAKTISWKKAAAFHEELDDPDYEPPSDSDCSPSEGPLAPPLRGRVRTATATANRSSNNSTNNNTNNSSKTVTSTSQRRRRNPPRAARPPQGCMDPVLQWEGEGQHADREVFQSVNWQLLMESPHQFESLFRRESPSYL
eukprot:Filipodium_phascolosomae@DN4473_c0_g1_i1.p1